MAIPATTIWEVETTGSNSACGGSFDPAHANMAADLGVTTANTASPVASSSSYTFVAGDVGAWLYIQAGTNFNTGWYKIASVAGGAATLNAAIGAAVLSAGNKPSALNTAAGCASVAGPTGGTWAIDYSQQSAAGASLTGSSSGGANSNVLNNSGFTKAMVGNGLYIASGTNATVGYYVIDSVVAGTSATVVGAANATGAGGAIASGIFYVGGALATPAAAFTAGIGSNLFCVKAGTYTQAANPTMGPAAVTPTGTVPHTRIRGYNALRTDNPTGSNRPTIQMSGGTIGLNIAVSGYIVENLIVDCNSVASSIGISMGGSAFYSEVRNCKVTNFKSTGMTLSTSILVDDCEVTGGITGATAAVSLGSSSQNFRGNYIHDNVCPGVSGNTGGNGGQYINNIIVNNTGASSDGIFIGAYGLTIYGNTIIGNGRDGIRITSSNAPIQQMIRNNILALNGASAAGYGLNFTTADLASDTSSGWDGNFYGTGGQANLSGTRNNAGVNRGMYPDVFFSGDPFTNKAGGDWSLNNTASAGAAIRGLALPPKIPSGGTTNNYLDGGAAQHQDAGGGGTTLIIIDDD